MTTSPENEKRNILEYSAFKPKSSCSGTRSQAVKDLLSV